MLRPSFVLPLLVLLGCGDDPKRESRDAGADAGEGGDAGFEPSPPALARITPCPPGWSEVADPQEADVATCEPFGSGDPLSCASDEAWFPGGGGCERIGAACPVGDFAEDVPADAIYVLAGAGAGGDGSIGMPFGTILEAVAVAGDGDVVALSKGTFDEILTVRRAVTFRGACVAETIVGSSDPDDIDSTWTFTGQGGVRLENLQIGGERAGIGMGATSEDVVLDGVLVAATVGVGLWVEADSVLVASNTVVQGTRADSTGSYGQGIQIDTGGRVELRRAVVDGNVSTGILVVDPGSSLLAEDVAIRRTLPEEWSQEFGNAIEVNSGGAVELARVVLEDNRYAGIVVAEAGTTLVARDLLVRRTQSEALGDEWGIGIDAQLAADVTLEGVVLDSNRTLGLRVVNPGTHVVASDLVVRDTESESLSGGYGFGVQASLDAALELHRAVILRNRGAGLLAGTGAIVDGDDVSLRAMLPFEAGGWAGYGGEAYEGAHVTLSRVAIERCAGAGWLSIEAGTAVTIQDLLVEGTIRQSCGDSVCLPGTGLASIGGGSFSVTGFRISDNVVCGVQLAAQGAIDLVDGEVSRNPIGANVQSEEFDVARLQAGVVYRDNDVTLDASALPVPAPLGGI